MSLPTHRTLVTTEVVDEVEDEIRADIDRRKEAYREAVDKLERYVEHASKSRADLFEITGVLWELLMAIGLKAVEMIWARRRRAPEGQRRHDAEGRCYHYYKQKTYPLRCVFGEGEVVGSQYVRGKNARSGEELCPEFVEMGAWSLGGAFGPRLALECGRRCTREAFEPAKKQLERFLPYVPSTRGLQGIVDRLGPTAGEVIEEAACPRGDVLVVQFDGRGLPKIRDEEYQKRCRSHATGEEAVPRRGRNESRYLDNKRGRGKNKSKKREVTVGIIYGLDEADDGEWEPVEDKHYLARMGDRQAVMAHLGRKLDEAVERDEPPDKILFLSDGARDYEDLRDAYLPDNVEHVIDYYHVCEYIWRAANGVYDDRDEIEAWVGMLKGFLCAGLPEVVLTALRMAHEEIPKRGPGNKGRRENIEAAIRYIDERAEMMPYDDLLAEGLEIGSGAVESAVRQVVELRFDGPGMRWGDERPDKMLNLVCCRLGRRWNDLEERLRERTSRPQSVRRITPVGVREARQMNAAA